MWSFPSDFLKEEGEIGDRIRISTKSSCGDNEEGNEEKGGGPPVFVVNPQSILGKHLRMFASSSSKENEEKGSDDSSSKRSFGGSLTSISSSSSSSEEGGEKQTTEAELYSSEGEFELEVENDKDSQHFGADSF